MNFVGIGHCVFKRSSWKLKQRAHVVLWRVLLAVVQRCLQNLDRCFS